ncbi:regulator of G-protein signaling 9-binding protein-like [Alligator sinensis]|uniref:Regulator of G-protein signaling 9-binding protein-like n=1 Tax=Alligator sinensis TaxID=38654 RepID=A0A3Q0FKJ5_ALLSI|nr:regulator of G-protein signaling 9-binding protein-like [Alligator sinensis]
MASRAPVGECAAAHAALGRVTARHRQLALLLGSAADCAQLREELQERGKEAQELGTGLEERVARVGAMLTEMETSLNIPVWTVEATEAAWAERGSTAEAEAEGTGGEMPGGTEAPGHCCTVS